MFFNPVPEKSYAESPAFRHKKLYEGGKKKKLPARIQTGGVDCGGKYLASLYC
jgi:hypothetical protein